MNLGLGINLGTGGGPTLPAQGATGTLLKSLSFAGTTMPAGVNFSRASTATDVQSGTLLRYEENILRTGSDGAPLEEQRTTSHSGYLDSSSSSFPVNVIVSQGLADPVGGSNASQAIAESSGTMLRVASTTNYPDTFSSGTVTHLAYIKPVGNLRYIQFFGRVGSSWYCNFDLYGSGAVGNNSAVASPQIKPLTDGGYLISYRPTDGGLESHLRFCFADSLAFPRTGNSTLSAGDGILVYAANAVNSYGATSLIPGNTETATTRAADMLSLSEPEIIPTTGGRIITEAQTAAFHDGSTHTQVLLNISNASQSVLIAKNTSGHLVALSSGLSTDFLLDAGPVGLSETHNIDLSWGTSGWDLTLNGTTVTAAGGLFTSPLTVARIGRSGSGNWWNGRIRTLRIYASA